MAKGASNPNSRQNRHVPKEGSKKKEKKEEEVIQVGLFEFLLCLLMPVLTFSSFAILVIDLSGYHLTSPFTFTLRPAECLPPSETDYGFNHRDFRPCNLSANHNLELLNEYRNQFEKGMLIQTEGKKFKAQPTKENVADSIRGLVDFQLSLALRSNDDKLRDNLLYILSDAHSYALCVQTDSIDKSIFPRSFCEQAKYLRPPGELPAGIDKRAIDLLRAAHMTTQVFAWIGGEFHNEVLMNAVKFEDKKNNISLHGLINDYMIEINNDSEKINDNKLFDLIFRMRYRDQVKNTFEEIMRRLEKMSECSPRQGITWAEYMRSVPESTDSSLVNCQWTMERWDIEYMKKIFDLVMRYANGSFLLRFIKAVILYFGCSSLYIVPLPPLKKFQEKCRKYYFYVTPVFIAVTMYHPRDSIDRFI